MRHGKPMWVAMIMVLAFVVFAGVTTASATRLCAVATSPCPSANIYPMNTVFPTDLPSGVASTITTFGSPVGTNPTLTCSASALGVSEVGTGGGAGVAVTVGLSSLSFTGCTSANPAGCESSGTVGSLTNAHGHVNWISGVDGTLTFTPPTVSFNCPILGANVVCTFGGSGTVDARVTGGATATIDIANQNLAASGGFGCPTASTWHAQYRVTKQLFITNS